MLTKIVVDSDVQHELPILGVTPKNSLLIRKVTGLNPPDRTLFIGDYSQDGGIYQGRRVGNRNVVFTIDLNPNPALGETVQSLREDLYKAFIDPQTDGDYLKLVLTDETDREVYLVGYCEKFETEIFDVETMCQISMICPDPYLRNNNDTVLVQDPNGWVQVLFEYDGTAETGFIARIYVTTATTNISLLNNLKAMDLRSPTTYAIGDIIIVNTLAGERSITLTKPSTLPSQPSEFVIGNGYLRNSYVFYGPGVWRCDSDVLGGGTTIYQIPSKTTDYWTLVSTPIVSHLDPKSQWLQLHSVDNSLRVNQIGNPLGIVANIRRLEYTSAYWGM